MDETGISWLWQVLQIVVAIFLVIEIFYIGWAVGEIRRFLMDTEAKPGEKKGDNK